MADSASSAGPRTLRIADSASSAGPRTLSYRSARQALQSRGVLKVRGSGRVNKLGCVRRRVRISLSKGAQEGEGLLGQGGPHPGSGYSTVTLLARLRGWSTSSPSSTATWYANSCSTTELRIALAASSTFGITKRSVAAPSSD